MKLSKKTIILCAVGLLMVAVITIIIVSILKKPPKNEDKSNSAPSSDVVVNVPTDISPNSTKDSSNTVTQETATPDIIIDVSGDDTKKPNDNNTDNSKVPVKEPEKPITTVTPTQPNGIVIGGDTNTETKYDCKTAHHHCANAENHAYITNLEIEGCPFCGSHSCPSFYALDEWGYTCYDVKKCPQYNVKKDPVEFCQICGRKNGDGGNGTCVQFVNACYCPNCGEYVEANTCHTCK
jgi:hypothetical protein